MSRVLIVSDIHEQLVELQAALERTKDADDVVWLGDWPDTFAAYNEARIRRLVEIMLEVPGIKLIGNHCAHYMFDHQRFMCSGFDGRKRVVYDSLVTSSDKREFRIHTQVGAYLLSHAGFADVTLPYRADDQDKLIQSAIDGGFDPIWGAGRARGGTQRIGGPTWLDWNLEFAPIEGVPQIVGHTRGKTVRRKVFGCSCKRQDVPWGHEPKLSNDCPACMPTDGSTPLSNWCLDDGLRSVAWIDTDTNIVTIEKL